jgi:hypothetical protein
MGVTECIHRIAIKDFNGCDSTEGGKDTVVCEFPGWEGKECPYTMLEKGEITEDEFYKLWLEAQKLDTRKQG